MTKATSHRLSGAVCSRDNLSPKDIDALYQLFLTYYRQVDRPTFDRDLAEKEWILTLRDEQGILRGFTTMKLYEVTLQGRPIRAVFNGNTIIDQAYWGEQELVRTWCRFMAQLKQTQPETPLYWYLICSGYRTYLFLPLFFREFYPQHDGPEHCFDRSLADHLGALKFPDEYRDGVVRVSAARECLVADIAVPSEARRRSPHVQFFLDRNPNFLRGDELVCMAEFSWKNTRRTARQALEEVSGIAC